MKILRAAVSLQNNRDFLEKSVRFVSDGGGAGKGSASSQSIHTDRHCLLPVEC